MGRKLYSKQDILITETKKLNIPNLKVVASENDGKQLSVVHNRYFTRHKNTCPACGSTNTRSSKLLDRKFKDILWNGDKDFQIVDLIFYQRYLRCNDCKNSVFPEEIDFALKGSRYTNRLAEKLAEGTLKYSYKRVCDFYQVPASTASVGIIMRRTIGQREASLEKLHTPKQIGIFEVEFYKQIYPIVLGITGEKVYFVDILADSTENSYLKFFQDMNRNEVEVVYIEPTESVYNATHEYFINSQIVVAEECIERYARNDMIKVVKEDGKRCSITKKYDKLTAFSEHLSPYDKEKIKSSLANRERLKIAYALYQELLLLLRGNWIYEELEKWVQSFGNNPDINFSEFDTTHDLIELFQNEVVSFVESSIKPPERYASAIKGICSAIENMPYCIFDVLRARMLFTLDHDVVATTKGDFRLGISSDKLIANINEISDNIKGEREYGNEY